MKSLEIVNRNIKTIKKLLYKLKDVQDGTKEDFEKYYHEQELKDFKIIKQDLEVLEMIKKGIVAYQDKFTTALEVICAMFDFNEEEYSKVKQWLEENDNGNE